MVVKYGLIAEDKSDIEVVKILARKVTGRAISAAYFVGKGCGPIKRKAPGWCKDFAIKGCTQILLLHDRDRNDAAKLRTTLEAVLEQVPQEKKVVVIPTEELEAWLLSDHKAIEQALKLRGAIAEEHHPELIASPKEYLGGQVRKVSQKTVEYINSVHNPLIAEKIDVRSISRKCPSFVPFASFFKKKK